MTHEELAELIAEETHTFKCGGCGSNWITPKSGAALLFHMCPETRSRQGYDWRTPRQRVDDDRSAWARRVLGPVAGAFEDAVGGEHQWYEEDDA